MANEVLQKTGTAIVLADTTDHSPAAVNDLGTRTDQIDLASVGSGSSRQSAKVDLGATRARKYGVTAVVEYSVAPTAGGLIQVHTGYSQSSTAGTGNPGGLSGSDAAYTGNLNQLDYVGAWPLDNSASAQIGYLGEFEPTDRYLMVVLTNGGDQSLIDDAVEMSIRVAPVVDEVQ